MKTYKRIKNYHKLLFLVLLYIHRWEGYYVCLKSLKLNLQTKQGYECGPGGVWHSDCMSWVCSMSADLQCKPSVDMSGYCLVSEVWVCEGHFVLTPRNELVKQSSKIRLTRLLLIGLSRLVGRKLYPVLLFVF